MKTVLVVLFLAILAGCSAMPTMQYCDRVEYKRDGSRITIKAECQAPVGGSLPGL